VLVGGGADQDQGLARELIPAIRFDELPPKLENLFAMYTEVREASETFLHFTRRHTIAELQQFCNREEAR
jgi:ferredoxin-nitrite reductase